MKSVLSASLTSALLITACSQSVAPATTADMPSATASMDGKAQSVKTATTNGTIKAIDTDSGKITLAHGPVPQLEWPAMTMAFKASSEQMAGVKVGQEVLFEFEAQGMDATITRISAER